MKENKSLKRFILLYAERVLSFNYNHYKKGAIRNDF